MILNWVHKLWFSKSENTNSKTIALLIYIYNHFLIIYIFNITSHAWGRKSWSTRNLKNRLFEAAAALKSLSISFEADGALIGKLVPGNFFFDDILHKQEHGTCGTYRSTCCRYPAKKMEIILNSSIQWPDWYRATLLISWRNHYSSRHVVSEPTVLAARFQRF